MSRWGSSHDLHFTPGDDTQPPLLTVPIARKEMRTMPHLIDAAKKQRALDLLESGRPVKAVAEEIGVAAVTLYRWKQEAEQTVVAEQGVCHVDAPDIRFEAATDDDDVPAPPPKPVAQEIVQEIARRNIVVDAPPEDDADEPFTPVPMTFTVEYDAAEMDGVLRQAILAWVQQATETHWGDGQNPSIRLPDSRDVPTRWIVQVTPTAMVPAEDA